MLAPHEIETLRRSNAMAPLSQAAVAELLDDHAQMARERAEIAAVLEHLPDSFGELRAALNRLHRIVRPALDHVADGSVSSSDATTSSR